MMPSLAERMQALRESSNTSTKSECTQPTSLATFLCIYNKAGHEVYINYMAGAKALHAYLSPIDIPDIPEELLPKHRPALFHMYEVQQVAHILCPDDASNPDWDSAEWFAKTRYLESVIIYLTCKEITDGA